MYLCYFIIDTSNAMEYESMQNIISVKAITLVNPSHGVSTSSRMLVLVKYAPMYHDLYTL